MVRGILTFFAIWGLVAILIAFIGKLSRAEMWKISKILLFSFSCSAVAFAILAVIVALF